MRVASLALFAAFSVTGAVAGGWNNWGGWGQNNDNNNPPGPSAPSGPPPPPPGPPGPPPPPPGPPPPPDNNQGGWKPPPPPGPAPPPPPPPGPPPPQQWGWPQAPVQLHPNGNWRKCLEVRGSWFQNGTPVDIFDCNGSPGQNWILNPGSTKVQAAGQPFCIDAGEWPNDGTQLKIWTCYDNLPAQQFWYTDDKRISLKDSGRCIDLTNGDTCNGNIAQLWQCLNFDVNQIWNA